MHEPRLKPRLQARIDLVSQTNAASVKAKLQEVQKLKDLRPLHKEEELAAKSALARSKAIRFGSTDQTTNIDSSDGWKVVTREKGKMFKQSQITETADSTTGSKTVASFVDVALGTRVPLLSSVRQPTAVGANK